MNKIVTTNEAIKISKQLHLHKKRIVLAGGCFDILHIGHIAFFDAAKQHGDNLFILLEHDETVRKLKGDARPIFTQHDRAIVLAALSLIDYVVLLPPMKNDNMYDTLVIQLNPAIIASTKSDPSIVHKKRQAERINAKLVEVVDRITYSSTSKLVSLLFQEENI